jgi:hypothetical protein
MPVDPNMLLGNVRNAIALEHPAMAQVTFATLDRQITEGGALPDEWLARADTLLIDAIDAWMKAPTEHAPYMHGNAQGVARTLSLLRSTTFVEQWEKGLNGYQNRTITGKDTP